MEIKVNNEFYNPLLKRKEISVEIEHTGEGTPERYEIRKRMASKLGAKVDNVFVVALHASTGVPRTVCSLQVYDDADAASSTVPEHIVIRNLPPDERAKVKEGASAKAEKAAKEAEAKPSIKAETKETKPATKPETESSKPAK